VLAVTLACARREDGMTLPELLVTLTIAMIITLATFSLVEVTMGRSGEIAARVDAVQRGRSAMDLMTRQLRSQVCLGPTAPASRSIVAGTATSVTFYVEMGDPSAAGSSAGPNATPVPRRVEKRSLTLETTGSFAPGTLVERRWVGTPSTAQLGFIFPADNNPTSTRELMRPIALTPTPGNEALPPAMFRFYGWNTSAAEPKADVLLPFSTSSGLSDADVKRVARIEITYRAKPRTTDTRASTVFYNQVVVRTVDPNAQAGELNVPCL
jgi:type II secretory pathway pseudopilin PulG